MPLSSAVTPDAVDKLDALTIHPGRPHPLGATPTVHGLNFAIYARSDRDVSLLLRPPRPSTAAPDAPDAPDADAATREIPLSAHLHRSGLVWHVEIRPPAGALRYKWRVGAADHRWNSNLCLDPCALALDTPVGPHVFNTRAMRARTDAPWAVALPAPVAPAAFDWQGVPRPRHPWKDTVIYEMHVRGFTAADHADSSSPSSASASPGSAGPGSAGSYIDVVRRIPYLKALGVTAVELLPVFEFNETEWIANSVSGKQLCNYWGYSTFAFFAPMNRFAKPGGGPAGAVRQFQYMVRELHRAGIEVILDVVYNHTAELGHPKDSDHPDFVGPRLYGMKQLALHSYYITENDGRDMANYSGCGNTISCNNVATQDFILSSIKYWAHELGVDGFRFDLASILTRGTDGQPLSNPPVVERLAKDVSLRDVKLIAEPWDCGGLYQVGSFPHYGAWAEWNGKFRDAARRFVRGDPGSGGEFATRLCGSQDLYGNGRRPFHSINFITAHDGFTLADLISYDGKHNHDNGENNNDGESHNTSWNCGIEGATNDAGVLAMRARQARNFLVALLVAAGTPMVTMGDEYGHTRHGNNNTWCHDNELNWVDWSAARAQSGGGAEKADGRGGLLRFTAGLIALRRRCATLRRDNFLGDGDVSWHGGNAGQPDWHSSYNLLAFALHGAGGDVYVAFNCGGEQREVELPRTHGSWGRVIDTNLEPPRDLGEYGKERLLECGLRYGLAPHSCIVLRQVNGNNGGADAGEELLTGAFDQLSVVEPKDLA